MIRAFTISACLSMATSCGARDPAADRLAICDGRILGHIPGTAAGQALVAITSDRARCRAARYAIHALCAGSASYECALAIVAARERAQYLTAAGAPIDKIEAAAEIGYGDIQTQTVSDIVEILR